MKTSPAKVYYSFAAADAEAGLVLDRHLALLRREGLIESWHPHCLIGGQVMAEERMRHLAAAQITLLLLSADYVACEACFGELQQALLRHRTGQTQVRLILWRPVDRDHPDLQELPFLPHGGTPIASWPRPEQAWAEVAAELRRMLGPRDATKWPIQQVHATGAGELTHDVFVSYHATGQVRNWVRRTLVPHLEAAGLRVILDVRDFRLGSPLIEEMERAVQKSRYTLAVLTPGYLDSAFGALENMMAQHLGQENRQGRLLTVMREPCVQRLGMRISPPLDMTDEAEVSEAMVRLIEELRRPLDS